MEALETGTAVNDSDIEKKVRDIKVEYLDVPVKSESDKKEYRTLKLENGLTVLLISDVQSIKDEEGKETENAIGNIKNIRKELEGDDEECDDESIDDMLEKDEKLAACSLCIGVGNFNDPIEIQGTASFIERILFVCSEKYPQDNDFDKLIKSWGGSSWFFNNDERTTYSFEVDEDYLFPAMERFAQFFNSSFMKKNTIIRELEVAMNDYKNLLKSESHKISQILRGLAGKNHPAAKFDCLNLITLNENIDDNKLYVELLKFRKRHYSAHRMTLAVQAQISLDVLEKYVKYCFSDLPNNHLPPDDFSKFKGTSSFDNKDFNKIYKIKTEKDTCEIQLTWVMPTVDSFHKSKPHEYVVYLIQYEGKGSLISYLRKKIWCLNTGFNVEQNSLYVTFNINLILTDEGYKHYEEVLEAVFSYINMLRREGPKKRIFDELQLIEKMKFRFSNEFNSTYNINSICNKMHVYPLTDILTSDLYFEYNPEAIKNCIESLRPDKVNIMLLNKNFNEKDFNKVEPWHHTKYSSEKIPTDWITHWKNVEPLPEFHMPKSNPFVSNNFNLIDLPENLPAHPVKIHHDNKIEIWHKVDSKFRLPEAYINIRLITPIANESIQSSIMLTSFQSILNQLIIEDLYDASVAEFNYAIYASDNSMSINLFGFNEKLFLLLNTILRYVKDLHKLISKDLFDAIKLKDQKVYYDELLYNHANLAHSILNSILTSEISFEKYSAISNVKFDEFVNFAEHLTDYMYVQCLVEGNISQEDALKNITECMEILEYGPLPADTFSQMTKVNEISFGEKCCRMKNMSPVNNVNSIVMNYYQSGVTSIKLSVIIELLMEIMNETLFQRLITEEQLGNGAICAQKDTYHVSGFTVVVWTESDRFTTEYIDEKIENFIKHFINILEQTSDDELNHIKVPFIKSRQLSNLDLHEEVHRHWIEIVRREYNFDRNDQEITALHSVTIDELRRWMCDHTINGKNFRKLSIQVVGTPETFADSSKGKEREKKVVDQDKAKCTLTYLTRGKGEKKKAPDYFITSIEDYKEKLTKYPSSSTNLY